MVGHYAIPTTLSDYEHTVTPGYPGTLLNLVSVVTNNTMINTALACLARLITGVIPKIKLKGYPSTTQFTMDDSDMDWYQGRQAFG